MKSLLVAPLLFAITACAAAAPSSQPSVTLHGKRFTTEFAITDATRARGLMMRTSLAPDHSMLFVFPDTDQRSFWMKNTLIPLDILYFDADRKLVSMQLDVPPCKADPCATYPSNAPARYVLELPAGTAGRIYATPGDELTVEGNVGKVE
ncbi:DUF192 domain-containing protein [Dyella marensis]|uniref:DUF192 domain-containing protein n=1 Tax=Dyella marensis TaxID=500610 RepID=UPI0031D99AED